VNETLLIIPEGKHHKVVICDAAGHLQLTARILGLSTGINVDLTKEGTGGIKVRKYDYAPQSITVFTTNEGEA